MAGSKLTYPGRARASSLLEVIISMIIILLVFGIAMMISANVLRASLSAKSLNAQALLQGILIKAEENKDHTDRTFTVGDFRVEQEVRPYAGNPELIAIQLTAYDSNRQRVAEVQKVIFSTNE